MDARNGGLKYTFLYLVTTGMDFTQVKLDTRYTTIVMLAKFRSTSKIQLLLLKRIVAQGNDKFYFLRCQQVEGAVEKKVQTQNTITKFDVES